VRLHEFNAGIIVPHEKTLVAPKATGSRSSRR